MEKTTEDEPVDREQAQAPVTDGSTSPTGSPPKDAPASDVNSTLKSVAALREKSSRAKNQKDLSSAFRHASAAWEAARRYPQDARLQQVADELVVELEALGQQLNSKYGDRVKDSSVKLIDK